MVAEESAGQDPAFEAWIESVARSNPSRRNGRRRRTRPTFSARALSARIEWREGTRVTVAAQGPGRVLSRDATTGQLQVVLDNGGRGWFAPQAVVRAG